ncbi:hypothetical protein [Ruegeria sp. HKCCD4318-2]|uniref:hypothetical protein n=1 Tax=Ruegeria sp. HKCCD4318-2 TaxID=2683020 RepID=UPI001C1289EF|nr:hypothetical protein [Ruegeria sp. HKCCD4318-2]
MQAFSTLRVPVFCLASILTLVTSGLGVHIWGKDHMPAPTGFSEISAALGVVALHQFI